MTLIPTKQVHWILASDTCICDNYIQTLLGRLADCCFEHGKLILPRGHIALDVLISEVPALITVPAAPQDAVRR